MAKILLLRSKLRFKYNTDKTDVTSIVVRTAEWKQLVEWSLTSWCSEVVKGTILSTKKAFKLNPTIGLNWEKVISKPSNHALLWLFVALQ